MDELSMHSETLDSLKADGLRQRKPPTLSSAAVNNNDDAHNVDDLDAELEPEPAPLPTIPLSQKKKKHLLRTASSKERSDYATSTEKKPHCSILESPTNPPIKRFLERQRSGSVKFENDGNNGNDGDGGDEESGHTTWLVKMGKKYETVLDSLPARCIGTICNIVWTGGFFLFLIFCIAALLSLSYLYDHKDSGKWIDYSDISSIYIYSLPIPILYPKEHILLTQCFSRFQYRLLFDLNLNV